MARSHYVKTSRKPHICGKGNHEIPAGDGYFWAAPGFRTGRSKKIRCTAHPFKDSELVSGLRSEPLAAREVLDDALDEASTIEEIESAWQDFESSLDDYLQQREGALEAWENGNSQLEELRDIAQQAYDEVSSHQIEEWPEEEPEADDEDKLQEYEEFVEEQKEAARDLAQGLEF